MARAVLAPARFLTARRVVVVASIIGCASRLETQTKQCSQDSLAGVAASRQKEVRQFRQRVESGPFFSALVKRFGKPEGCELGQEEGGISLSYVFHSGARLEARINPSIELSEQRVQLRGINEKGAVALLKEAERHAFGEDGCGINWSRTVADSPGQTKGSREVLYEGDTCNCRARVIYENDSLVGLGLSSAC